MKNKVKIGAVVERIDVPELGQLLITRETCDRYAVWFAELGEPWEIENVSDYLEGAKEYAAGFLEGSEEQRLARNG
jgi:hypothetical protein